jgi:hypothetical protein
MEILGIIILAAVAFVIAKKKSAEDKGDPK